MSDDKISKMPSPEKCREIAAQRQQEYLAACSLEQLEYINTQVPESYKRIVAKCFAGKGTPKELMKANCMICIGFERKEVAACTAQLCVFHTSRPWKKEK